MSLASVGKRLTDTFASPAMTIAGWGLSGAMSYGNYRGRVQQGENQVSAFAKEAGSFAVGAMMSGPAAFTFYFGVPLVRAGVPALIGALDRQTSVVRSMRTPFSQRFEHTEVTARAQQLGLQRLAGSRGHMGSEAAAMARRYSR